MRAEDVTVHMVTTYEPLQAGDATPEALAMVVMWEMTETGVPTIYVRIGKDVETAGATARMTAILSQILRNVARQMGEKL